MSQETVRSAEQIKQEIDFHKENLKFLNSFYLPLASGLILLPLSNGFNPYKAGLFLAGSFAIGFLTLLKKDARNSIDKLIKEL